MKKKVKLSTIGKCAFESIALLAAITTLSKKVGLKLIVKQADGDRKMSVAFSDSRLFKLHDLENSLLWLLLVILKLDGFKWLKIW